jgi:arachidonate 15-lipoxygenase
MSDLGYETSEVAGFLADRGDLDPAKNNAWAAGVKKDYYNHYFYKDVVPLAVAPPDDRSEGAISYNFRRNAGDVDLLADIAAWKVDVLGLSSNFFKTLPTPLGAVANLYKDDGMFASFFLRGPDPTTLELVKDQAVLPASLSVKERAALESSGQLPADFEKALEEGRVFHIDFSRYADIRTPPRFASWPHAVFMSVRTHDSFGHVDYSLAPVAIFEKSSRKCSFPKSSDWEFAKRAFLTAAANYHELGAHLARCHLVMERYALATYRNLPPWHPVGRLLRPHFKFMVATNHDAINNLINSGGPVDKNFAADINTLVKVTLDAFTSWDLRTYGGIEADLARRGLLGSDTKLPFWPYKDHGLKVYGAIRNFVRSYLGLWYASDGATYKADLTLQNWRRALRDEYRAGVMMEPNAPFEDLVTACTNIIWTCGPQHSAVNYAQYDFLGDAKTLPFCIQLPGGKQFEPSRDQIGDQAAVIARLSRFRYDRLGDYSGGGSEYGDLGDPHKPWRRFVDRFQNELKGLPISPVSSVPLWQYPFLLPKNITNGISI